MATLDDVSLILSQLDDIPDSALREELHGRFKGLTENRFNTAFSAYGVTRRLEQLDDRTFAGGSAGIDAESLRGIRYRAVRLMRMYVTLVYMRSDVLERGLDDVVEGSKLNYFKQLYRSGCRKKGEDTLPQHIRNALCHGGVDFLDNGDVHVKDQGFDEVFDGSQLDEICKQVYRLYCLAYEARVL
jgi:hypothetical protein